MKGLFAVIATAFLLSLSIGNVSASWGWNPDLGDWFDFNFGGVCSTNAQCGTDNECIRHQCIFGTCQKAYAPINTPASECLACDGNGSTIVLSGTPCNNGAGFCMPSSTGGAYCYIPVSSCDDGNACTDDFNMVFTCAHQQKNCSDDNPFTIDSCNTQTGCVHTISGTGTCNDNNACTTGDLYGPFGTCAGTPITCNDSNDLTTDSCNPQIGCVFTPIETPVVPEFGVIVGTLTVLSAIGMFFFIRRK